MTVNQFMKQWTLVVAAVCFVSLAARFAPADSPAPIDVNRAREIMQKKQKGEQLTPEEQQYLDRVRQEIQKRRAQQQEPPQSKTDAGKAWTDLKPLTDMTANDRYKGEDGGLYGGGRNEPPEAHRAAYLKESKKINPLDADGRSSGDGKIGLIIIGFSNTSLEAAAFKEAADGDPQKSPRVVIVNGAIGGRSAVMWAYDGADVLPPAEQQRLDRQMDLLHMPKQNRRGVIAGGGKDTWPTLDLRVKQAGLAPRQVQVLWMKHVEAHPQPLGDFPAHAKALEDDMAAILIIAKKRFPNLRVALLSNRTYAGWAGPNCGSPEPYAYESGYGVRWLVQRQIQGDPLLNFDAARGPVKTPILLWGPYLWACGDSPRKVDGLVWSEQDVRSNDHLHPSGSGCKKVTELLLNFLKTDAGTRSWFLARPGR